MTRTTCGNCGFAETDEGFVLHADVCRRATADRARIRALEVEIRSLKGGAAESEADRKKAMETLTWFMEHKHCLLPDDVQDEVGEAFGEVIMWLWRQSDDTPTPESEACDE